MILSEAELELGDDADGIIVLEQDQNNAASSASRPGVGEAAAKPGRP